MRCCAMRTGRPSGPQPAEFSFVLSNLVLLHGDYGPASEQRKPKNTPMLGVLFSSSLLTSHAVPRTRQRQLKTLGDTIRECRARAGMSQERLAEKAGLHPVYVGKVERGEQWISLHAYSRAAEALGVRVSDLVRDL